MQETWKKFVYPLIEDKKQGVEEDTYHRHIENQLMLLGWEPWKGEIIHRQSLRIGNRNRMEPDILIARDGEYQFVIEVKRPNHTQQNDDINQLESYMRQLKLDVGIYMGEYIEVFYDKPNTNHVVSVFKLAIDLEEKRGAHFVEKFSKETFTKDGIVEFCEARIEEMERQASLNKIREGLIADAQTQITESLTPYLMEKYGNVFSETDIKGMLSQLTFSASQVNASIPIVRKDTPAEPVKTSPEDNTKKRVYDHTGYSLEGGEFLGKNKFVYAVVSTYVRQHPGATFAEIQRVFPPELQGSFGVVQTMDYIRERNFKGRRYFKEPEFVLYSGDGIPFAVSTEWGKTNIERFLKAVRDLGYDVRISTSDKIDKDEAVIVDDKNPNGPNEKLFHINVRGCKAHAIFNENDHSMRILKGSLLPQSVVPSYRDGEKRNAIIAAMSKATKDGYLELQRDYVLNSPSTAASYCTGRSCNGWQHWVNDAGQSLDELYRSE